jgi:hypothetical protein
MIKVSTIGLDLAKNVFQVHGFAGNGMVVVHRRRRRVLFLWSIPYLRHISHPLADFVLTGRKKSLLPEEAARA